MSDYTYLDYFGYGIMAQREMLETLTQRPLEQVSYPSMHTHLLDYRVVVQRLQDIPDKEVEYEGVRLQPRSVLRENYGPTFETHNMIKQPGARAYGVIWKVTERELRLIREWQLEPWGWFEAVKGLSIRIGDRTVHCHSEMLRGEQGFDKSRTLLTPTDLVKDPRADNFTYSPLSPLAKSLEKASEVAELFWADNPRT